MIRYFVSITTVIFAVITVVSCDPTDDSKGKDLNTTVPNRTTDENTKQPTPPKEEPKNEKFTDADKTLLTNMGDKTYDSLSGDEKTNVEAATIRFLASEDFKDIIEKQYSANILITEVAKLRTFDEQKCKDYRSAVKANIGKIDADTVKLALEKKNDKGVKGSEALLEDLRKQKVKPAALWSGRTKRNEHIAAAAKVACDAPKSERRAGAKAPTFTKDENTANNAISKFLGTIQSYKDFKASLPK